MAGPDGETVAPPTLAGNVETFANVPAILRYGADWFRELGTAESPGTVVCTVSGDTVRGGVAEIALGHAAARGASSRSAAARDPAASSSRSCPGSPTRC